MLQVHCFFVSTVCTSSKHWCGTGKSKHCCPFEYAAGQYGGEWQQQFSSSECLQGASFRRHHLELLLLRALSFFWSFYVINQFHCHEAIRRISHRFPLLCRRLWSHLPVISVTCHNKNVCQWRMCNLQDSQTLRFIKNRIVAAAGGVSVDVCHTGFSFSRNKLEVKVSCQRLTASLCLRAASLFTLPSPRFLGSHWNRFTISSI